MQKQHKLSLLLNITHFNTQSNVSGIKKCKVFPLDGNKTKSSTCPIIQLFLFFHCFNFYLTFNFF